MLRIRTRIGSGKVFTLYFRGEWVTVTSDGVSDHVYTSSVVASNLQDAGANHLAAAQKLFDRMKLETDPWASWKDVADKDGFEDDNDR